MKLEKIISGGQTGADQGALDGARARKFPYGGAIPAGRKTEAGPLPASYDMEELQTEYYPVRTRKNVEDGDGTLIVSHGHLTGGSYLTLKITQELRKPWIHIDFNLESEVSAQVKIGAWLESETIRVLNVAGPRASSDPLIYAKTKTVIYNLLGGHTLHDG